MEKLMKNMEKYDNTRAGRPDQDAQFSSSLFEIKKCNN